MSISKEERAAEQRRVTAVAKEIRGRLDALEEESGGFKADIVSIRKHFWDDVTINLDGAEEVYETFASLKQQAEILSERERSHRRVQEQIRLLRRLRESPYFGRIDFREEGDDRGPEAVYIGTGSLIDESGLSFLIYDWRAPVASMYYDYGPGPAGYETPGGTISGEVVRKRQYIIRGEHIQALFDTGLTIGDELLQHVLGGASDTHMKSIVATIQREQNRVIRSERPRLLVVEGAAGSGKTSAALQRIAYLLYRYRETLRAEQIVLFSPNAMFSSYVSTVLPELGEDNMVQSTFQEYLDYRLGDEFRAEDMLDSLEYVYGNAEGAEYGLRLAGITAKAQRAFMERLNTYKDALGRQGGMMWRELEFRGAVIVSEEEMNRRFYELDPGMSIPNRLEMLAGELVQSAEAYLRSQLHAPWVEEEVQTLDSEAYLAAYNRLQQRKRFSEHTFDDHDREYDELAKALLRDYAAPLKKWIRSLRFVDTAGMYAALFADPALRRTYLYGLASEEEDTGIIDGWCGYTVRRMGRGELAYEDGAPYLFFKDSLEGFRINASVRHVFVDEAQDYTPFQWAYLRRIFPRSRWTILGDPYQGIGAHQLEGGGFGHLAELAEPADTERMALTRTYRSTKEIVKFTRSLLPGSVIEPFEREGPLPTLTVLEEGEKEALPAAIRRRTEAVLASGHRTVAILCKNESESIEAYEALRNVMDVSRISRRSGGFEPRVLVLPAYLAKGVEFDAVLIYDVSQANYGSERERKLLYTACTRAMHELHLFSRGEPSGLLRDTPHDTYMKQNALDNPIQ
ncbi:MULTISPECIES: RNA polymerase recycling motor HelD [Paenibacillus]|uniref:RNA polymerase recycling motor HelD n=1 Tax=Paenibacillus TaxID=44249 RepID=UPI0022B87F5E|nr:RNA polymerase recycling motor HelD [Paenibacillus caseinilyticus]MCZ8521064.1 ATP-binding domain-containing protein [Paenibacillus caseinilyticus]